MEKVLHKIKKLRELRGLTQEAMAYELNISQKAYCQLENGVTRLDIDRLLAISKLLEVTPSMLFHDDLPRYLIMSTDPPGMVQEPRVTDKTFHQLFSNINKLISLLENRDQENG